MGQSIDIINKWSITEFIDNIFNFSIVSMVWKNEKI